MQFLWSGTSTSTTCDEAVDDAAFASPTSNGTGGAAADGASCTAGNLKLLTMIITGMFAAACIILTAIICRVAYRIGNRPARSRRGYFMRHTLAWTFNLGFWAGCCWVTIAYGRCSARAVSRTADLTERRIDAPASLPTAAQWGATRQMRCSSARWLALA